MSEESAPTYDWTNAREAWARVGDALGQASARNVKELAAYLDWSLGFQRELLDQGLRASQELSSFREKQWAFLVRLRESVPLFGMLPTGMETVQGMVQAVVREAEQRATSGASPP